MLVLKILGVLLFTWFMYLLIIKINSITYKKYNYELFIGESIFIIGIGYGLSIWGYIWYSNELSANGDILNGLLVLAIGVLILLVQLYINIKHTKFFIGIFLTIIQFILCIPLLAVLGILLVGLLFAAGAVKPVYNIND